MDKLFLFLAGAAAATVGGLIVFLGDKLQPRNTDASKIREEVRHEIEATPAGDLVNAAPDADKLHTNAAGIAERAKQRLRDRARTTLSGHAGSGTFGSGTGGDTSREIWGTIGEYMNGIPRDENSGAFAYLKTGYEGRGTTAGTLIYWTSDFKSSRVVPTGPEFSPRTLSCRYWRRVA